MKTNDLEAVDLERLKKLAGIQEDTDGVNSPLTHGGTERAEYMRKYNIKPGTDEWFKLWFARPGLTGERPMPKQ